jgi:hypothetical protein
MTAERRGEEFAPAMTGRVARAAELPTEELAARAEAIRTKLTTQLAGHIASARAAERDKLEQELAIALGIVPEAAAEFGWQTLMGMVHGIRSIADLVLGHALPEVDADRRRDLLVSFGVAEEWSKVITMAQIEGPTFRQAFNLDDQGTPKEPE